MEYRPKHPQPFSLSDALKFDPATITEGSALACYQITAHRIKWPFVIRDHTSAEFAATPEADAG